MGDGGGGDGAERSSTGGGGEASERSPVREVGVSGTIRLGQFLKLAGLVEHGADAKDVVAAHDVTVNGRVETRRGRQLAGGDVVAFNGARARVVTAE